jgi:ribose transport system permease protein
MHVNAVDQARVVSEPIAAPNAASSALVDLRWRFAPVVVPWLVAVAMLALTAVIFPKTFTFGGLVILTALLGVLVLASLGQSLVIGTGGIDLSAASVMTLSGMVLVIEGAHGSTPAGIAAALGVGIASGAVNGLVVEFLNLNALVVTLATGQVAAGIASILFQRNADGLPVPHDWKTAVGGNVGGISYILIGSIGSSLLFAVAVRYTALGRRFVAASAAKRAASYLGLRVRTLRMSAYVVAALVYSVAGVALVGVIGTASLTLGDAYQLSTIVAVVLGGAVLTGGRFRAGATVAGAVFLTLVNQNLSASGATPGSQSVILGVVLIVAIGAGSRPLINAIRRRRALRGLRNGA